MLLVDANVLLHAVNRGAVEHTTADGWLREALDGGEAVAFAWAVLLAFLRLATHPSVFPRPLAVDQAADVVERWLAASPAVVLAPTSGHLALLRGLLVRTGTGGSLVSDAHLAALALEHGATVISFDRDFGRFAGVSWRLPASLNARTPTA